MKMIRKLTIRMLLLALPILIPSCLASTDHEKKQQAFSNYVKNHEISWMSVDKPIFVLGEALHGKTTLTLLLTNAKLKSKRIDGRIFNITDDHNKINNARTIERARNIVPDFMFDNTTRTTYYDCPGFAYTNTEATTASEYTVLEQLKRSKAVKFIFTINFESMIKNLLKYILGLFQKLSKYIDAISLVVTKVPNHLDDAFVLEKIVHDLKDYKERFCGSNACRTLLDAFLTEHGSEYSKIRIFRRPREEGTLSNDWINSQKAPIVHLLNDLRYVPIEEGDFGSFLYENQSKKLQFYYIFDRIMNDIDRTFSVTAIKKHILKEEENLSQSLAKERTFMRKVYEMLSELMSSHQMLSKFKYQFVNIIEELSIDISGDSLERSLQYFDLFEILGEQFEKEMWFDISIKISKEMENLLAYVENSMDWYNFLNDLHEKLSSYNYNYNIEDFAQKEIVSSESGEQAASELNMAYMILPLDRNLYPKIEHLQVNTYKLKLFHSVWQQASLAVSFECQPTDSNFLVKGYNVRLSSVVEHDCLKNVQHLQIFATNKVFIDAEIMKYKTNKLVDVAIIAPKWEIIDSRIDKYVKHRRIFNLNGANGEGYGTRAGNSTERGDNETPVDFRKRAPDGNNGKPGTSGGRLLAIGQSIVGKARIEVFANGGSGGKGQDGGHGLYFAIT